MKPPRIASRVPSGDGYVNGFVGRNIGEPQLRAEAQNAFNTPQFGEPVGNLTDANFGGIITGIGERRLQLGVRFGF